jgi:hypothetical protein
MDSADKATNKAMSAAYKYAALQAFCIPTEADNDADAHHPEVKTKSQSTLYVKTGQADATDGAVAGYVKPPVLDKSKVSEDERKRNAKLFLSRVIFADKDLKQKAAQAEAAQLLDLFKDTVPDRDKWFDYLLDAEQEDVSNPAELLEFAAGLPKEDAA